MQNWIKIGTLSDIPRLGARTIETAQGQVAVFRTNDDEVFALFNRCPHKGGPLSAGSVDWLVAYGFNPAVQFTFPGPAPGSCRPPCRG